MNPAAADPGLLASIQQRLARAVQVDPERLPPDCLLEGLGMDSLAIVEFMLGIEDEFGIRVPEGLLEIKTVSDIVSLVEGLLREKRAA